MSRDALAPTQPGERGPDQSAEGQQRTDGQRSADRPGFALRFEAGRGILALARPLAFSVGVVTALDIDLGRLPSPIDLRLGASRFRSRRGTVLRGSIRLDLDALAGLLSGAGVEVRALGGEPDAISIALADAVRTIACELVPSWDGRDLLLAMRNTRAAVEGPRAPIGDAIRALIGMGATLDGDRGALRISDPIERALTEALVPHGWRVPDARALSRAVRVEGRALFLALGETRAPGDAARRTFEEARALGPILEAIAGDRIGDADMMMLGVETRIGPASHELEAIAGELALAASRPLPRLEPGAPRSALALRASLRARDVEGASRHARELASIERCDDIAIEGLRAASSLALDDDPPTSADLAARALARRPGDPELALEWLARASRAPALDVVIEGVRGIRATSRGPMRGDVLRASAAILDRVGAHDEARTAWDEALRLDADDPTALEGLARSHAGAGRHGEALDVWDRVAAISADDPDAHAHALVRAAERARGLGHGAGAASRLERAVAAARDDRVRLAALVALAEIRRELGARAAAAEADASILALAERISGPTMLTALGAAAHAAVEDRAEARARALVDALRRVGAPAETVRDLATALDALELDALDREAPESSTADPSTRALRARAIAERLRAAGRLGDAARALARAGAITRDAATLRAAVELAEKAEEWDAALEVLERAIAVVGSGPAQIALEARREAIRARRL